MKERFESHNFQLAVMSIIRQADKILSEYAAQGFDVTVRQLYYRFIALDLFPESWIDPVYNAQKGLAPDTKNTLKNYMRLGRILTKGRMAGMINWNHLVDRGRGTSRSAHWKNPGEIIMETADAFRIDKWADQPVHVQVMVEKQTLEGVVEGICYKLDVPFAANKGYSSASFMYRKGKELARIAADGKEVVLVYLGDHDPSGLDMDRDIIERITTFGNLSEGEVRIHRASLTMEQIQDSDAPPNPAKLTDSRAAGYIAEHGDDSWEIEALEPRQLVKIVENEVLDLRDQKLWDKAVKREDDMREELEEFAEGYEE